jgi:hypothetical protein
MATFLDAIGVLESLGFYDYIFPFILMFAITFGLLSVAKPFGEDQRVNIIVATIVGFLFISFSGAVAFVNMFIPMLMILMIIIIFIMMAFKFSGASSETIAKTLQHPAGFGILIGIIIILIAVTFTSTQTQLTDIFSPINESELSPEGFALTPEAGMKQTMQTLFHPTIVGIIVMLAIFAVTVYVITRKGG